MKRLLLLICLPAAALAQEKVTFQDHLLPLIENNCAKCHNPDKKKGDLDLSTYGGLIKGGGSGPVVVSGNPDSSKLWKAITHVEEPTMPPNKGKMPDKELEVFKKWIAGGLLETSGSKAIAAAKPAIDFTLASATQGKPSGPPPMPAELSLDPVIHTARLNPVIGLAVSPWAPVVALTSQKQILLYHADKFELLGILAFSEGQPADLKFSRNGKLLIAGGGHAGKSGRVLVWDITTGQRLMTIGEEYDTVLGADLSPDQSKLALGGPGRLVKIYNTKDGELLHKKKKHTDWVTAVSFSPNGEMLASADRNGGVTIWDAENGQELFTVPGHKTFVTALSWRNDSKFLASSSEDGSIKLWEMQEGKQARTWEAHKGGALSVAYAHDGRLVSCGRDSQIIIWDGSGSKVRGVSQAGEILLKAGINEDGSQVWATTFSGKVFAWNAKDGKQLATLNANPSPLGDQVAALESRIKELQARGDKPSDAFIAAEAQLAKANAESEEAARKAEAAKAKQTEKEAEVVRLKEVAAKPNPPADIQEQLAKARQVRLEARQASTNAVQAIEAKSKLVQSAKEALAKAKEEDPAKLMAKLQTDLRQLKAAQIRSTLVRSKETVAAKQQEQERLLAQIAQKKEEIEKLEKDREKASDPDKAKIQAALKSATTELKSAEAAALKCQADVKAEESRLKKLAAEYEKVKTAALGTQHTSL